VTGIKKEAIIRAGLHKGMLLLWMGRDGSFINIIDIQKRGKDRVIEPKA
jgi:hypothetical protein